MHSEITYTRARLTILALCLLVLGLFGINLYIQTDQDTSGNTLLLLQNKEQSIEKQNAILEQQILKKESLDNIAIEAKNKGFIDGSENAIYITK